MKRRRSDRLLELRRQAVHACGAVIAVSIALFGSYYTVVFTSVALIAMTAIALYRSGTRIAWPLKAMSSMERWFEREVMKFERRGEFPLMGPIYLLLGSLIAVFGSFTGLYPSSTAIAAILVLTLADAASTFIGKLHGRRKLPINRKKTLEGSSAFFFVTFFVLAFMGFDTLAVILTSLVLTFVEMLPGIDDNVSIPAAAVVLLSLLSMI